MLQWLKKIFCCGKRRTQPKSSTPLLAIADKKRCCPLLLKGYSILKPISNAVVVLIAANEAIQYFFYHNDQQLDRPLPLSIASICALSAGVVTLFTSYLAMTKLLDKDMSSNAKEAPPASTCRKKNLLIPFSLVAIACKIGAGYYGMNSLLSLFFSGKRGIKIPISLLVSLSSGLGFYAYNNKLAKKICTNERYQPIEKILWSFVCNIGPGCFDGYFFAKALRSVGVPMTVSVITGVSAATSMMLINTLAQASASAASPPVNQANILKPSCRLFIMVPPIIEVLSSALGYSYTLAAMLENMIHVIDENKHPSAFLIKGIGIALGLLAAIQSAVIYARPSYAKLQQVCVRALCCRSKQGLFVPVDSTTDVSVEEGYAAGAGAGAGVSESSR